MLQGWSGLSLRRVEVALFGLRSMTTEFVLVLLLHEPRSQFSQWAKPSLHLRSASLRGQHSRQRVVARRHQSILSCCPLEHVTFTSCSFASLGRDGSRTRCSGCQAGKRTSLAGLLGPRAQDRPDHCTGPHHLPQRLRARARLLPRQALHQLHHGAPLRRHDGGAGQLASHLALARLEAVA